MKMGLFLLYSSVLGIGSALVGLVVGFMIARPTSAVASILIVIGLALLTLAILIARRYWRRSRHVDGE